MNVSQNDEGVNPLKNNTPDGAAQPPAAPALAIVPGAGAAARLTRLTEHLASSGLAADDVPGWSLLRGKEAKAVAGVDLRGEAVAIPYLRLDGTPLSVAGAPFVRLRLLDQVDQTQLKAKYIQRQASGVHIYIPAAFGGLVEKLDKAKPWPLIITEGEKKAEAGCKHLHGIPVLGIGGVAMWSAPKDEDKKRGAKRSARELHPELLEAIQAYKAAAGDLASVIVLLDSDGQPLPEGERSTRGDTVYYRGQHHAVEKRAVALEAIQLAAAVRKLGIPAAPFWCPPDPDDGAKRGLDDWLLDEHGDGVEEVLREIDCTSEDEEAAAEMAAKGKAFPLVPMGVSIGGEELVLHTKDDDDALVRLPVKDISHARLAGLLGTAYVQAHYMRSGENGGDVFDKTAAVNDLVGLCEAAGRWHDVRVRGPGVWLVDGRVLVSAIEGVYDIKTGKTLRGADRLVRPASRNIYGQQEAPLYFRRVDFHAQKPWVSALPLIAIPADDVSPAEDLLSLLQLWSYDRASSPKALAGWLAYATVGQALPRRPGVWVYGQAGSGKTTLADMLRHLLHGGALFCSNGASGYTAIGLRQALQDTALPVIMDEAERPTGSSSLTDTGQRAINTLESSLVTFRTGYSATAGDEAGAVLTNASGTPDGEAKIAESHAVWCWLSISPPGNLQQSDEERIVRISINPLATTSSAPPDAEKASSIGQRVRAWSLRNVSALQAAVDWVRTSAEAQDVVPKARYRDTWGTFAAAWGVLRHGKDWSLHTGDILDALREIAQDQATSGDGRGVVPTHEKLFGDLLALQLVLETEDQEGRVVRKTRTVGNLLALAQPTRPRCRPDAESELLMRYGIKKIGSDKVFFAGSLAAMRELARKAGYFGVDVDVILGQHPQAERAGAGKSIARQVVGGGVKASGVVLPIPAEVLEQVDLD